MILPAWQVQSEPPNFSAETVLGSMLETAAVFQQLPWLLPAVVKLRELQVGGRCMEGIGDLRISEVTADFVRKLLSRITVKGLPVPRVIPISGGGIGLLWKSGQREAEFTVYPSEDEFAYVVTKDGDQVVGEGTLKINQPQQVNQVLGQLISV